MKKIFLIILMFLMTLSVSAKNSYKTAGFGSVINEFGVEKNSISISIKSLDDGKAKYELNEKILMHPASVQKLLTLIPAIEVLGSDYEFVTSIYKRGEDDYVIKLGADPYLKTSDLKQLAGNISKEAKRVYIDNSILEKKDWGEGWQWDDDMNVLMPKFNSYNLDNNLIKITVMPTEIGQQALIINPSKYPLVFFNNVITSDKNDVSISRDSAVSSNALTLNGFVNKPVVLTFPSNNLKRYFDIQLNNILVEKNIYLRENISVSNLKDKDEKLDSLSHPISMAINDILKNSNNFVAETLVKLAGGKKYGETGSDILGIKVFNSYCEKNKLDNSRIRLADASGVSKNNLVTADFITDFLVLNKDNEVLDNLAIPGEGTLTHRMLPLKNNLRAKTGTLSDISSIAGYLTSKSGNKYAFCIMINDPSSSASDLKTLEDYIIREAYLKL